MDVSENSGTPKSSIHPFWGTPIFGNTHMTCDYFCQVFQGQGLPWGCAVGQPTEEKHNPAKLGNIDQLLIKFKGQETTLYRRTLAKPAPVLKGPETIPSNIYQLTRMQKSLKDMKEPMNED